MRKVLQGCTGARGYFDDILVAADTKEELAQYIKQVFENLTKYNIKIKGSKCEIGKTEIEFLGLMLSGKGIRIKDTRKEVIDAWEFPKNNKQLKHFLGFVGFITRFLPDAASILAPLSDLTKGTKDIRPYNHQLNKFQAKRDRQNRVIPDNTDLRAVFQRVKEAVNKAPMLYHPDPTQPFHLKTDASKVGIGAYLYQIIDGEERPVCFFSTKLNERQLAWSVNEKEAYGVYMGILKFRQLLIVNPFFIHTDHANLQFIRENSAPKIVRWFLRLQEFKFWLDHIPREQNAVSDSLAGAADHADVQCGNLVLRSNTAMGKSKEEVVDLKTLSPEKATNEQFSWTQEALPEKVTKTIESAHKDVNKTIETAHNSYYGHMGARKTLARIKMRNPKSTITIEQVSQFIRECATCQKMSAMNTTNGQSRMTTLADAVPWRTVAMDYVFIGNEDDENSDAILTFTDHCTRKVALYAVRGQNARNTAEKLIDLFGREGPVKFLKSDNGSHFINETLREFNKLTHTHHLKSIPYRSQSNGICERANKEVNRHLKAFVFDSDITMDEWPVILPLVQRCMNSTKSSVTGHTPDEMMTGQNKELEATILASIEDENGVPMIDLNEQMALLNKRQKEIIEIHQKFLSDKEKGIIDFTTEFKVGDKVLCTYPKNKPPSKLHLRWLGPCTVTKQEGSLVTMTHCSSGKEYVKHVNDVKPYVCQLSKSSPKALRQVAMKDSDEFEIASIQDHKGSTKKISTCKFKVYWEGYDEPEWIEWKLIRDTEAVENYAKEKGLKLPKHNKVILPAQ